MSNDVVIIYTTVESDHHAKLLANDLIQKKLCACINVFPITSFYEWEGSLNESLEQGMLIKTSVHQKQNVIAFLNKHHPYKVPAILEIPVASVNAAFQNWITTQVS